MAPTKPSRPTTRRRCYCSHPCRPPADGPQPWLFLSACTPAGLCAAPNSQGLFSAVLSVMRSEWGPTGTTTLTSFTQNLGTSQVRAPPDISDQSAPEDDLDVN